MAYQPSPYDQNLSRYDQPGSGISNFQAPLDEWKKYLKKLLDGEMEAPKAPGPITPYGSFGANPLDRSNPDRVMYQRQPDHGYGPLWDGNPEDYRQQVAAQTAHVPQDLLSPAPQPVGAYNLFTPQTQYTSTGGENNQTQTAANAARRAALNATAQQLQSAEFRRTLQALMMEGGLIPIDPENWRP